MSLYGDVRRWWASRTINWGALVAAIGLSLEYASQNSNLIAPYFGKWGPLVVFGLGLSIIGFRFITTKPIGKPQQ